MARLEVPYGFEASSVRRGGRSQGRGRELEVPVRSISEALSVRRGSRSRSQDCFEASSVRRGGMSQARGSELEVPGKEHF